MDALSKLGNTPQSEPVFGKNMVQNNAGGYVFEISATKRLERFLLLGTEGGTYYVSEPVLTLNNANVALEFAKNNPTTLIAAAQDVLINGRALKRNAPIFALSLAAVYAPNKTDRCNALEVAVTSLRTATDFFTFLNYLKLYGGFGAAKRKILAKWYTQKTSDELALQVTKYRNRVGFTHKDALRLLHPTPSELEINTILAWIVKDTFSDDLPSLVKTYIELTHTKNPDQVLKIINNTRVPWELLPTEVLTNKTVWETLITQKLPILTMLRNITRFDKIGLLGDNPATRIIIDTVRNKTALNHARIHPLRILMASSEYLAKNRTPEADLIDALDDAFYLSFTNLPQVDKKIMIGLDVSGSMTEYISPTSRLTSMQASAAMAMSLVNSYSKTRVVAFSRGLTPLPISKKMRLDQVLTKIGKLSFSATDCALPVLYALEKNINVDAFIIFTDNETWCGDTHPVEALKKYRAQVNPGAKFIVCATTATEFSIADPNDSRMLDIVGFDANIPAVINSFITE